MSTSQITTVLSEASFTTALKALKQGNLAAFNYCLSINPKLLDEKTANAENIVHLVVNQQNTNFLNSLMQSLNNHKKFDLLLEKDNQGQIPLHIAVKNNHELMVKTLLNHDFHQNLTTLVNTVTNDNKNCLQLAESKEIIDLLESYAFVNHLKPLKTLLEEKDFFKDYLSQSHGAEFLKNLKIGFLIINKIRQEFIFESNTHPSANLYSQQKIAQLDKEFTRVEEILDICLEEFYSKWKNEGKSTNDENFLLQGLNIYEFFVKKYRKANCSHLARLALKLIVDTFPECGGEVYALTNGNHEFVVIGRDKNSDPKNFETWGKNAVVIDPWLGEAFPADQIPQKMHYHYQFGDKNGLGPFQQGVHVLEPVISINGKFIDIDVEMTVVNDENMAASNLKKK